jgi:polyphosphate kinase
MSKKKNSADLEDLYSPKNFFNREISFIEFNARVLEEVEGNKHPLLERLKFIIILSSNLDEFFMIRVAGLKSQISAGMARLSYDGLTPRQQLNEIRKNLLPIYQKQEDLLRKEILPELEKNGIILHHFENLPHQQKKYLENYFIELILPVLTPLTLDPAHPFPKLINRSLNVAFVLKDNNKPTPISRIAFLQIPSILNRLIKLDIPGNNYVLIESVIKEFAGMLFPGLEVEQANTFRVTRNADIELSEDEADDLLFEIAEQIKGEVKRKSLF